MDPLYATGLQGVRQRALYNLANCEQWLLANADVINWQHVRSPAAYRHAGLNSLQVFGVDFVAHHDRFLVGALPRIPMPDDAVDVALCANLLFAYADTLDIDFHVAGIIELSRVARSQVLIHPANARDGSNIDGFVSAVRQRLWSAGLRTDVFRAPSSWLRDASTMRVIGA